MIAPRAILFDLGGTLVESDEASPGTRLARALGDPARAAAIDALVLRRTFAGPEELAARLAVEFGLPREPHEEVAAVWADAARPAHALDGAATCLAALRPAGARVGIVANVWTPAVLGVRAGWASLFAASDGWFASSELGHAKPSVALLQAALDALEVKPGAALVVGDDFAEDVTPAIALGASVVWLRPDAAASDPNVVTVDPHAAPFPVPADVVPAGAVVARSLGDVRRVALTWLWAGRADGARVLTRPLAV